MTVLNVPHSLDCGVSEARRGVPTLSLKEKWLKPRPYYGLDCLIPSKFRWDVRGPAIEEEIEEALLVDGTLEEQHRIDPPVRERQPCQVVVQRRISDTRARRAVSRYVVQRAAQ